MASMDLIPVIVVGLSMILCLLLGGLIKAGEGKRVHLMVLGALVVGFSLLAVMLHGKNYIEASALAFGLNVMFFILGYLQRWFDPGVTH
jgi:hypothetical protein